jgi:hypothetical protein
VGTAVAIFFYNHAGLSLMLLFVAGGVYLYYTRPAVRTPFVDFLFAATNMMLVSVIVGVVSGSTWRCPYLQKDVRAQSIKLKKSFTYMTGHIIFAGHQSVLFYEYHVGTHLFPGTTSKTSLKVGNNQG